MNVQAVTRLAAVLIITLPLLLSVDVVSAGIALALSVACAPLVGVSLPALAKRALPLIAIAPVAGISMLLYGRPEGHVYAHFWWATITDNSISLAIAVTVRVLAVAMPVLILLAGIDPTDLGDGLAQIWRLPARFVIGAVAAVRLISLFRNDWEAMSMARRSRGLGDSGRIRRLFTQVFGLLVLSLRRGGKLAVAMEARGFGRYPQRTWAREARMQRADWLFLLAALGIAVASISISVATGYFRFLGA